MSSLHATYRAQFGPGENLLARVDGTAIDFNRAATLTPFSHLPLSSLPLSFPFSEYVARNAANSITRPRVFQPRRQSPQPDPLALFHGSRFSLLAFFFSRFRFYIFFRFISMLVLAYLRTSSREWDKEGAFIGRHYERDSPLSK